MYSKPKHKRASFSEGLRYSLVSKINLRFLYRCLISFLVLNITLIIITLLTYMNSLDKRMQSNAALINLKNSNINIIMALDSNFILLDGDVKAELEDIEGEGVSIFALKFPLENSGGVRENDASKRDVFLSKNLETSIFFVKRPGFSIFDSSYYTVKIGTSKSLSYSMNEDMKTFFLTIRNVLIIEAVILLLGLFIEISKIQEVLSPISDLSTTVHTINGMDVNARISIPETQNELMELAQDINDMLDRIQGAHAAQAQFVSDASHELRTPISVVRGYADLLARWGKNDEAILNESIVAIRDEAESMKLLVDQLLFLARGDTKRLQMNPELIDINALVREIYEETTMVDSEHIFHLGNWPRSIWINADEQLVKQALRVFIDNAIKYTQNGNGIYFSIHKEKEKAVVIIRDEGIGMSPEQVPLIFDRFYRGDEARQRSEGGSGLGLSIARQILKMHEASIEVVSLENIGTKIRLEFPVEILIEDETNKDMTA